MAALIGALRVSLSADTAQFEAGMKRAQATAATTSSGIQKSLGLLKAGVAGLVSGLSVGMFASVVKGALDYAGSLGEVAQQLGVTTKELQVFRYAAAQNGIAADTMDKGLQKLTLSISKAQSGSAATQKAFKAVGVEMADLETKSRSEIWGIMADQMVRQGGAARNAAAGQVLLGKAVGQYAPLLDLGSAGLSALAQAAEELGIVLSDEQIRKADDTADKLDALKTVLSAKIAGVVADNADSIIGFADSLGYLVSKIGEAISWLQELRSYLAIQEQIYSIPSQIKRAAGVAVNAEGIGGVAMNGGTVTLKLPPARPATPKNAPQPPLPQFLAGGGGSKKGRTPRADHSAQDKLQDEYQFAEQQRRAEMDILRAKQDLAVDYHERNHLSIQMLDLEHESNEAEMKYQVELFKLTAGKQGLSQAQADQLRIAYDIKDGLERQKIAIDDENERRKRAFELSQNDFERRKEVLDSQAAIAKTAAERRKIELELLQIAYEQKRQALQHVLDTSLDANEIENARRDLANLDATYGNDRQGVMDSTRNPLEEWAASVPQSAAEINEALQSIQANGLDGLTSALTDVITGTRSLKDAFGELAKSIIADILQMTIKMLIFRALSSALGGLGGGPTIDLGPLTHLNTTGMSLLPPGFAGGGSFQVLGRSGTDRNIMSMNGLPIARVSHGERVSIANDNVNGGGTQKLVVELRDEMLDAKIAQGADVQIVRRYPAMRADTLRAVGDKRRRSP